MNMMPEITGLLNPIPAVCVAPVVSDTPDTHAVDLISEPAPAPSLAELAKAINAEHQAAERTARKAIEHARDAGECLLLAKAQVEHGQWLPWLSSNCPALSARTARAYMQLSRNWGTLETKTAESANLSIDAALKLLTTDSQPSVVIDESIQNSKIDSSLLQSLPTTAHVSSVVALVERHKIPAERHADLIQSAAGWSPNSDAAIKEETAISVKGAQWWDRESGAQTKRWAELEERAKHERMIKKYGSYEFDDTVFQFVQRWADGNAGPDTDLIRCSSEFHNLSIERLEKLKTVLARIKARHLEAMDELEQKIDALIAPVEKDVTPRFSALGFHNDKEAA